MSTELDAYLRRNEIGEAEFASVIGRDRSMVNKLRNGVVRPTLELAHRIEDATNGEVRTEAWLPAAPLVPPEAEPLAEERAA